MERKYKFYTLCSSEEPEQVRYVGVTCRELNQRLSQHKYTGKNPKKRNTPVAKWIFSLLEKNQTVIITKIDECDITKWENKEIELIKKYRELGYKLLNLDFGGKGIITKEKREKEGLQRSAEAHEVRVVQLDLQGNYITTFKSINNAKEAMGLQSKSAISNVLKGRSKSSCGFYWVYESDYILNNHIINFKNNNIQGTNYYQYCPDTLKLVKHYLSERSVLNDFLESSKSNAGGLKTAVQEKITWKDFYWTLEETNNFSDYFNDKYKVFEIDSNNNIITKFKTNIDAAKYFNLADSTISNYIRNKTLTKNNTYLIKNKKIKI